MFVCEYCEDEFDNDERFNFGGADCCPSCYDERQFIECAGCGQPVDIDDTQVDLNGVPFCEGCISNNFDGDEESED